MLEGILYCVSIVPWGLLPVPIVISLRKANKHGAADKLTIIQGGLLVMQILALIGYALLQ